MNRSLRILLLLIVSQAICLAFGLWLQDTFIVASAEWTVLREPVDTIDVPGSPTSDADIIPASVLLDWMYAGRFLGFLWICGLQSVAAYLLLTRVLAKHDREELQIQEESLIKSKELIRTRDAIIFGLAKLAESRDEDTGHHLERIALYSTRLASALRRDPKYRDVVTPSFVRSIGISSALHDIGKVGVEDRVLLKPGRLDTDERGHMQTHTTRGGECIRQIERQLGNGNFLNMAREIAFCHHERWDGTGYPAGLKENEIPLAARIVSIADVYDALASRRVYKDAYSHEKCVEIIREGAGSQFDPHLVEVFLSIESQFRAISQRFAEPVADFITHEQKPLEAGVSVEKTDGESSEDVRMTKEQEQLIAETVDTSGTEDPSHSSSPTQDTSNAAI